MVAADSLASRGDQSDPELPSLILTISCGAARATVHVYTWREKERLASHLTPKARDV